MALLEGNLSVVAVRIFELLHSSDLQESARALGVHGELKALETEFRKIRDLIFDEEMREAESSEFKARVEKLESVLMDADDWVNALSATQLDDISSSIRSLLPDKVRTFLSTTGRWLRKEAKKIRQAATEALPEHRLPRETIGFGDDLPRGRGDRGPLSPFDKSSVVGRDVDRDKIVDLAVAEREGADYFRRVISIVGVKGIGKTALAQLVFNDETVSRRFYLRSWVRVSGLLDLRLIGQGIIESLEIERNPRVYHQMDDLQMKLRDVIGGQELFLVLDDVRDENREHWISLRNLLTRYECPGIVLVTTRSANVANIMGTVQPHTLDRLSEEDSRLLLEERLVFNDRLEWEEHEIRRSIAANCKGVPLVICHVASLLRSKQPEEWWSLVDEKEFSEALKKSGFQFEGNDGVETAVTTGKRQQSHSFEPLEKIVGRDSDIEAITRHFYISGSYGDHLLIIPIVGTRGLGKTALAQLIYNDWRNTRHFDLKIWVCLTEVFDLRVIVNKIIASITDEYPGYKEWHELERDLNRLLRGVLYLLVLDDMWYEDGEEWSKLEQLLSVGAYGSRIVVTTRKTEVASITGKEQTYYLDKLDDENSWDLFTRVAFEQGDKPIHSEVMKLAREIVKKCGGIPLLIKTVGNILYFKDPETEWQSFYDKELSKILENEADIQASLKLSYDHLPHYLKYCISYCALFPKDYEIEVQTLVKLWMSQGFVERTMDKCPEDVGYDYFMDLLRRSFFQEIRSDELGNVIKCKMPNSIYDHVRSATRNVCATLGLKVEISGVNPRHISFDFHFDSAWQIPISLAQVKKIRTLILPRQSRFDVEGRSGESVCNAITKFKFLRMLDLHNSGIKSVPSSIGKLKHLRYLDLSQNVNLQALPNSITRLRNLQTLKLNHCSNLQILPRDINKLVNLRNLENESCYSLTHMPRGLSKLLSLQTISEFVLSKGTGSASTESGKLDELMKLNNLSGRLKIKNLRRPGADETASAFLKEKQQLWSLTLIWDTEAAIDSYETSLEDLEPHPNLRELSLTAYGGLQFSSWLSSLMNLVKLFLSKCMRCEYLPPLDGLPCLQVLVVDGLSELRHIVSEEAFTSGSASFFPKLKELRFANLPKLTQWWEDPMHAEYQTFPCLSKLIVENCPMLTSMPLFPSLDELVVLNNTPWEPFQQTIACSEASSSTSYAAPLSKLRTLRIINMADFDANILKSLLSLRTLTLDHLLDIKTVLEGLKEVASLQELHIWRCSSLEEISGWISGIKSLRTLSLRLCPNLRIPSDQISLLMSLQRVEIDNCPQVAHIETMVKDRLYTR